MAVAVANEPAVVARAIRAAADVAEVEEDQGFLASVYLVPGGVAVALLDRSLNGATYEGQVLRQVMLHTAGAGGFGLFAWYRANGRLILRCMDGDRLVI